MKRNRIFITHCEANFGPTEYAIEIIFLIGCIPVIAEKEPKLSRTVRNVVYDSMDSCDAVIVMATPDLDGKNGKTPSQSVVDEIGQLQRSEKFKNRYIIIKEETVVFGPMITEAYYEFSMLNYGPIAKAILTELKSMELFRNYYELPGSDLDLHELMENVQNLQDLRKKGILSQQDFKGAINTIVTKLTKEEK